MIKKCLIIGAIGALSLQACTKKVVPAATVVAPEPPKPLLQNGMDTLSFALGKDIGNSIKTQGLDSLNMDVFMTAIKFSLAGKDTLLTQQEISMSISDYLQKMKTEKLTKNREAGQKFLEANKTQPGTIVLPSGLQYQIMKHGTGTIPKATDRVKTHYVGTLIDGTVFDSSVERGEPAVFPVNGVISGWTEALTLMPVGSKWKLFLPDSLAYGERQAGQKILPGSALVFEVELLDIVK
ncbi:FKBP-type peptidyl-prolyl cis-trans isomerase [uncultured Chitinophaga sp.]|uniref:FKBP-type peptidyl-prolyl cis-trans isomerase n=1 Tax=uncultured Chitinophaga sp. TaxID=339340 RepID=UPI00345BBDDA